MTPSPQRLPRGLLTAFLVLLNMFIPLSMDLYLPALPQMGAELGNLVNLTLSLFFLFYAVGALVLGPLSDKHGRRGILLVVLVTYTLSSAACALAPNLLVLVLARCVQGVAAGGISTLAMAVIKDSYAGKARASALALTQTVGGIAPMFAPLVGTWIMSFSDWRMTFVVLAVVGVLALVLAVGFSESLPEDQRFAGTLWGALGRIGKVLSVPNVLFPVLIFALGMLPFLGYITASSYIYLDQFHLTREQYSLFFAGNALASMLAPLFYVKFGTGWNRNRFALAGFVVTLASGLGVVLFGSLSPFAFFGLFMATSMVATSVRPFSTNLVFDQHTGDNGALSSVLGTSVTVMGSIGMALVSLPTGNPALLLGVLISICAVVSLVGWVCLLRSRVKVQGV